MAKRLATTCTAAATLVGSLCPCRSGVGNFSAPLGGAGQTSSSTLREPSLTPAARQGTVQSNSPPTQGAEEKSGSQLGQQTSKNPHLAAGTLLQAEDLTSFSQMPSGTLEDSHDGDYCKCLGEEGQEVLQSSREHVKVESPKSLQVRNNDEMIMPWITSAAGGRAKRQGTQEEFAIRPGGASRNLSIGSQPPRHLLTGFSGWNVPPRH